MYWPSAAAAAADGDADPAFAGERDHLGDVFWAAAADHRLRPVARPTPGSRAPWYAGEPGRASSPDMARRSAPHPARPPLPG